VLLKIRVRLRLVIKLAVPYETISHARQKRNVGEIDSSIAISWTEVKEKAMTK